MEVLPRPSNKLGPHKGLWLARVRTYLTAQSAADIAWQHHASMILILTCDGANASLPVRGMRVSEPKG